MPGLNMELRWENRLCKVNGKLGYFHTWEHYSKPLEASPLVGGAPAGIFSKVFGIVEFPEGVKRVELYEIQFCDEQNDILSEMTKHAEEYDGRTSEASDRLSYLQGGIEK